MVTAVAALLWRRNRLLLLLEAMAKVLLTARTRLWLCRSKCRTVGMGVRDG